MVDLINRQTDIECCGEADAPLGLFEAVDTTRPDMVLMDLCLGDADGLETIKSLHVRHPALPMLVLSQSDENLFAERALRAGARRPPRIGSAETELPGRSRGRSW